MSGSLLVLLAVSLAGVVLLPVFGAVLHFQPQLVHGLHVDPHDAERNCYLAAGCYGVTLLLGGVAFWFKRRRAVAAARDALHTLPGYAAAPVRRSLTPREKKLMSLATSDADERIQKPQKDKTTKKTKRASPRKPASTDGESDML